MDADFDYLRIEGTPADELMYALEKHLPGLFSPDLGDLSQPRLKQHRHLSAAERLSFTKLLGHLVRHGADLPNTSVFVFKIAELIAYDDHAVNLLISQPLGKSMQTIVSYWNRLIRHSDETEQIDLLVNLQMLVDKRLAELDGEDYNMPEPEDIEWQVSEAIKAYTEEEEEED